MQTSLLGFRPTRQGLFVPDPVGLAGFERQGMDQAKKNRNAWRDYGGYRDQITNGPNGYAGRLWDGAIMRWMDGAFANQLSQYNAGGPIWAMHMLPRSGFPNGGAYPGERGASGTDSIPLTNSVVTAYIHMIWPSARTATRWRAHNLNGDWGSSRVPGAGSLLQAKRLTDGAWVTIDSGFGPITNLTGDTGYRRIATAIPCLEHRLFCADNAGPNSAQSLCFLDIQFAP
jgi:hypothetical protein